MLKFHTETCLRSESSAQFLSKLNNFSYFHAALYNYNETHDSPYDTAKLTIHFLWRPEIDLTSNFGNNSKKKVSFDHMVQFIDEQNFVTKKDFDCGTTFCREAITKNENEL